MQCWSPIYSTTETVSRRRSETFFVCLYCGLNSGCEKSAFDRTSHIVCTEFRQVPRCTNSTPGLTEKATPDGQDAPLRLTLDLNVSYTWVNSVALGQRRWKIWTVSAILINHCPFFDRWRALQLRVSFAEVNSWLRRECSCVLDDAYVWRGRRSTVHRSSARRHRQWRYRCEILQHMIVPWKPNQRNANTTWWVVVRNHWHFRFSRSSSHAACSFYISGVSFPGKTRMLCEFRLRRHRLISLHRWVRVCLQKVYVPDQSGSLRHISGKGTEIVWVDKSHASGKELHQSVGGTPTIGSPASQKRTHTTDEEFRWTVCTFWIVWHFWIWRLLVCVNSFLFCSVPPGTN